MAEEQYHKPEVYLSQIAKDLTLMRKQMTELMAAVRDAESEVHEKMRRFIMYFHDLHDIKNLYVEHGHAVPKYILQELERCDDRCRQLIEEAHSEGNTFEKVRREMAKDPANRWDHTRAIGVQK